VGIVHNQGAFPFYIINTTIADNSEWGVEGSGVFVNNIFTDNGGDVELGGTFYNNYIDYTKLDQASL